MIALPCWRGGAVLAEGDYDSVSRNPLVREAYMGSEAAEEATA